MQPIHMVNDKFLTKKISAREKEDRVNELIHWVRDNLKDEDVSDFTSGRFITTAVFIDALCQVYQGLGVRGVKGLESDFALFIAGNHKNKIYVSYAIPVTESHKEVLRSILGVELQEIDQSLSRLVWR